MTHQEHIQLIDQLQKYIEQKNNAKIVQALEGLHAADLAEILDDLDFEEALYVIRLLDSDITSSLNSMMI